jgi:hypothetical protein
MLKINFLSHIFLVAVIIQLSGCTVITVASAAVSVGTTAVGLGVSAGTAAVKGTVAVAKGAARVTGLSGDEEEDER